MLSGAGKGVNMTKGKKILICVITAILVGACVCTMTVGGALRSAVFLASPYSAFCMEYEKLKVIDDKTTCYRIIKNKPAEYGLGELETWKVTSVGPFYYAYFSLETW